MTEQWKAFNASGEHRVIVTKSLPGHHWLDVFRDANCRVEIYQAETVLTGTTISTAIGDQCAGVIGQLTEPWDADLFSRLAEAGGKVYSNYAVGYDNVEVEAATRQGIAVGNTPGVLTETTAELAVALTFAAARRIVEADPFMRNGAYQGWLPDLLLGELLRNKTVGVIGTGRIGTAYARMMMEGHHMNLLYYNPSPNPSLEVAAGEFDRYLRARGEQGIFCRRVEALEQLLREADVLSLHPVLNEQTRHLVGARELTMMKENAVLINVSRGPVIDEDALVQHCATHPEFRVGLDVYEQEPDMAPGLNDLENVVLVPHIGSATRWTREGMAVLAARNVAGVLLEYPAWEGDDIRPFLSMESPSAVPSLVNRRALNWPVTGKQSFPGA